MRVAGIALVLLSLIPAGALAQDETGERVEHALVYFEAARAHFEAARFTEAAEAFERSHALLPRAELLFNAALSHERAGHDDRASTLYESYLVDYPTGDDIVETGQRLAALRERAGPRDAAPDEGSPTGVGPMSPPEPASPSPEVDLGLVAAGGTLAGLGVVAGAVALAAGLVALDHLGRLDECGDAACPEDLRGVRDEYVTLATLNTVLVPIAAALAVSGVVLLVVGLMSGDEAPVSAGADGVRLSF